MHPPTVVAKSIKAPSNLNRISLLSHKFGESQQAMEIQESYVGCTYRAGAMTTGCGSKPSPSFSGAQPCGHVIIGRSNARCRSLPQR